ncbi:DedA family protein [Phocaeicola plebeius]|jgi:membrane-associated protein|uniref:DedA family protein n=1 Tax=Phocaeicola plebeius TaxID=310297 RepID=UPI002943C4CC|nr:DedA family protein [Phocaeicola plebeius]
MDFFADFLLHIDQHLVTLVQEYHGWTYALLFLIIFCETGLVVLPFLPGDSLLFVSGAVASLPGIPLEISLLIPVFLAAAVLGDSCNYLTGRYFGKKLFTRPGSRIFKQSHLEKTHRFFQKYGGKTIIIARFVPIVRTFAPFVAGMGHMNYYVFMTYNLIGAVVWVFLFCMAGYFLGNIPFVRQHLEILLAAIVLVSLFPALIEYIRIKNKQTTV